MIKIWIDQTEIEVTEGTSILQAARMAGVNIPSMCFEDGHKNHPSCMVCLVKDKATGKLLPSCAHPAMEGMEILSDIDEVREARQQALELLLSDHVGDCEAPCRRACPAFMNIPLMNRLIAEGKTLEALKVVKEEIALPYILGYICPAPCEKVCRRNQADGTVAICQLKKFVAAEGTGNNLAFFPEKEKNSQKQVAVIGTGPAGLASAFYLLKWGHHCVLFDKNEKAGGSLRYAQLDRELPPAVLDSEINMIQSYGAAFRMNTDISRDYLINEFREDFDAVIIATGDKGHIDHEEPGLAMSETGIRVTKGTFETSVKGIFACGSAVQPSKMAVRAVAQGKAAAWSAHQYLQGKASIEKPQRRFDSKFGKLAAGEVKEYLKESTRDKQVIPDQGNLKGFSMEEAMKEALRCMHCDCRKPDTCKLRLYADEYRADRKMFLSGTRKAVVKYHQHENVVYEPEKCIKCGLCVDITCQNKELTGLTFVGRGFDIQINVPFGKSMKEALTTTAVECVRACPTGALSFKADE